MSKTPPRRYDPAVLNEMVEPLSIRVERRSGPHGPTPIELPPVDEGGVPGTGYTKEHIPTLESYLVNEIAGGGVYQFLIADAENKKMEWTAFYDPRTYPPRPPPAVAAAQAIPTAPTPASTAQPSTAQVTMSSNPWPTMIPMSVPTATSASPTSPWAPASPWPVFVQQPAPPPPPMPTYPSSSRFDFERERNDRVEREKLEAAHRAERERYEVANRTLIERLAKAEQDAIEFRHKMELDRDRQAAAQQLAELKAASTRQADELRAAIATATAKPPIDEATMRRIDIVEKSMEGMGRLLEKIVDKLNQPPAPPAPSGPSPEVLALQEQMRRTEQHNLTMQAQMERERDRAAAEQRTAALLADADKREAAARLEADRREATMREQFRMQEDNMKAQLAMVQRALDDMKARPVGPDPMLMHLQQSQQNSLQMIRDMMQMSQVQMQNLQSQMMSPRDILAITKDAGSGADELRRNLMATYGDLFDRHRMLLESALQISGGSGDSATARTIMDSIQKLGDLAKDWVAGKGKETIAAIKAQETAVKAQAEVAAEQARAAAAAARAAQTQINPNLASMAQHEATVAGSGLNGANVVDTTAEPTPSASAPSTAPAPRGANGANGNVVPLRRPDRTVSDEEWFGPAMDYVNNLRLGVVQFLTSLKTGEVDPKTKQPMGVSPEMAAEFIVMAAGQAAELYRQGVNVRAFTELYLEERYADFLDVLLPNAPQGFRDEVVRGLGRAMRDVIGGGGAQAEARHNGDEQEDDDDDDDESSENDGNDAARNR